MHTRWMDKYARGFSDNYEMGNLSIIFQSHPEKANKTFDEQFNINLFTSGNSANKIKEEIQQIINKQKQAFLEKNKRK